MMKPEANPFFQMDFGKLAEHFKESVNMGPLLAVQRRNIETATAIGRTVYDGLQAAIHRHTEYVRQMMEEATSMASTLASAPTSMEDKIIRQAEASSTVLEKSIANARDIAEALNQCHDQVTEIVNNRLKEGLDELRVIVKSRQQDIL